MNNEQIQGKTLDYISKLVDVLENQSKQISELNNRIHLLKIQQEYQFNLLCELRNKIATLESESDL